MPSRAHDLDRTIHGNDSPNVAIGLNNLGNALCKAGKVREAKQAFATALTIDEAAYDDEGPKLTTTLNSMGIACLSLGGTARARECLKRALRIDENTYGRITPTWPTP